ncbi:MAG: response regulator transcription factor [Flavobacteriales bacterium]|nr:response regulator transcription factor [Flavobacteriales bacterium]
MKILIVEDEHELAADMVKYLSGEQYRCEVAADKNAALERIDLYDYDCILLDLMLPDGSGLELLETLRQQGKQDAVIIISAKNSIEDKVSGLKLGADDYLAKPFHLAELSARVFSVIRRKQFDTSNVIRQNELKVDLPARSVTIHDVLITLTRKEFDLLLLFLGNRNKVISKSALAEHLSGDLADMMDNHDFIYAHVKNLKRKLTEANYGNYLTTVYGTGYKWKA